MSSSSSLIPAETPESHTLKARRAMAAKLETELAEMERVYEKDQAALREFEKRYRPAVGVRFDELERLREETSRLRKAIDQAKRGEFDAPEPEPLSEEAPQEAFVPEDDVKKIFRELARRVHPDLAKDPDERRRRHELMAEASAAYRAGDLQRLQWLFEHWEAGGEDLIAGSESEEAVAARQIAWLRYRIREMHLAIGLLNSSSLSEIMRRANEARSFGKNLVAEMRNRLLEELVEVRAAHTVLLAELDALDPETAKVVRDRL